MFKKVPNSKRFIHRLAELLKKDEQLDKKSLKKIMVCVD